MQLFGTRRGASETMILLPFPLLTQAYITFWTFAIITVFNILNLPHTTASGRALIKYVPAEYSHTSHLQQQQHLESRPSLQRESVWNLKPSYEATQKELGNRQYTDWNNDTLTLPTAMDPKDRKKLSIE